MKIKLPLVFLFFAIQFGFSQTKQLLKGSVRCEDFALNGIEVLNLASKRTAITDNNGNFTIMANANDSLMFVSKYYEYKKIALSKADLAKINLLVSLVRIEEQLQEVVVLKMPNIRLSKDKAYEQGKRNELALEKAARNQKPLGVYDGTLINSPDLMKITDMILSIFIKKKETRDKLKYDFKDVARKSYNDYFFENTLELKKDEIFLFLEYCDADPKSKTVLVDTNPLKLMDFLLAKNIEFKKIKALKKDLK